MDSDEVDDWDALYGDMEPSEPGGREPVTYVLGSNRALTPETSTKRLSSKHQRTPTSKRKRNEGEPHSSGADAGGGANASPKRASEKRTAAKKRKTATAATAATAATPETPQRRGSASALHDIDLKVLQRACQPETIKPKP
jgi:hypothetical protein